MDVTPIPILILFIIAYVVAGVWGYKGPRKYRRERFLPMKLAQHQKEEEPNSAGDIFEENFEKVTDPDFPAFSFQKREEEVYFKYKAAHMRYGYSVTPASWSYYVSDRVKASHALMDYARVVKMLGAMGLEMWGNWLHRVLRVFIATVYWLMYIMGVIMPWVIFIGGNNGWMPRNYMEEGWSFLNLGLLGLIILMVFRLCVENFQYFLQTRSSIQLMRREPRLLQYDETKGFVTSYLYRQWGLYTASYIGIIIIMLIFLWITIPPGGMDL